MRWGLFLLSRNHFTEGVLIILLMLFITAPPGFAVESNLQSSDTVAPASLSKPPKCGVQSSSGIRGFHLPPIRPGEKYVFYDDFSRSDLGPDYQINDGLGVAEMAQRSGDRSTGVLRYYALPRGVEFAGDTDSINIDGLGRPYSPSLLIARPFTGETWTFDSKVMFGFQQPSNGRSISFLISFGGIEERSKYSLKITRYNDNPGRPQDRGVLAAAILEDGKSVAGKAIELTSTDTYYFCLKREKRTLELSVSSDGSSYSPMLTYTYGLSFDQKAQWWIINGSAFAPGAFADIDYVLVRSPAEEPADAISVNRTVFKRYGSRDKPATVTGDEILQALSEGKDIDIRFATVIGDLDIRRLRVFSLSNNIRLHHCSVKSQLIGSNLLFEGDLILFDCEMVGPVNFSGATFRNKVDFSSSIFHDDTRFILANFFRGASFSGATFKQRPFFRLAKFLDSASFYYSNFEEGADISSAEFKRDVSFADFSFSKPESPIKPDLTFFGTTFGARAAFISSLQRPITVLGEEVSFQQAKIKDLIITSGDPSVQNIATEQTGKGLWAFKSSVSLLDATVESVTLKNISFKSTVDLRGVAFTGAMDSVRLVNVDFKELLLDEWPVGKVVANEETRERMIRTFESGHDKVAARRAFFDLLPVSNYYEQWLRDKAKWINAKKDEKEFRPEAYTGYAGYKLMDLWLIPFWTVSGYGTSLARTFMTGVFLIFIFAGIFVACDRGRGYLIRIEKPLELKTRLSETPVLSFGEVELNVSSRAEHRPKWRLARVVAKLRPYASCLYLCFILSLNTVGKVGFGNIRVRLNHETPRVLERCAWLAWVIGYGWYLLLLYTLTAIPVLRGLVGGGA